MNNIKELIGTKVKALIESDEEFTITGKVIDVEINDFYFQDCDEPIYITVNIMPDQEYIDKIDDDECSEIPLENIYKLNN